MPPSLPQGGKVFFGELGSQPIPGLLEVFLGQEAAIQLFFHLVEEEEVGRGQAWQIGGLLKDLDTPGGQQILNWGCCVDRSIVLVEPPDHGHHFRSCQDLVDCSLTGSSGGSKFCNGLSALFLYGCLHSIVEISGGLGFG